MSIKQELRLQKVKELAVQGKGTAEISRECGVSVATTEKDLVIVRDRFKEALMNRDKNTATEIIMKVHNTYEQALNKSWLEYERCKTENARIGSLKLISEIISKQFELYSKLGIVEIVPSKMDVRAIADVTSIQDKLTKAYYEAQKEFREQQEKEKLANQPTSELLMEDTDTSK